MACVYLVRGFLLSSICGKDRKISVLLSNHGLKVFVHCGDGAKAEVVDEDLQHTLRDECRERRTDMDVLDAKAEKGKER